MLGEAHLRFLWEGATSEGQAVLTALAWLISRGELGTAEAIAARLHAQGHRQENTHLSETLSQLKNLDLVKESADGRFSFTVDLVRSWIKRKMM
jgi:hypothetical protein